MATLPPSTTRCVLRRWAASGWMTCEPCHACRLNRCSTVISPGSKRRAWRCSPSGRGTRGAAPLTVPPAWKGIYRQAAIEAETRAGLARSRDHARREPLGRAADRPGASCACCVAAARDSGTGRSLTPRVRREVSLVPVGPPVSRRLAKCAFEGPTEGLLGVVADLCADLTDTESGRAEQPGGQVQSPLGSGTGWVAGQGAAGSGRRAPSSTPRRPRRARPRSNRVPGPHAGGTVPARPRDHAMLPATRSAPRRDSPRGRAAAPR